MIKELGQTQKPMVIHVNLSQYQGLEEEKSDDVFTSIFIKDSAKAVEGGIQKEGADAMKKIAKHIKNQAEIKTNKEANRSVFKIAMGGLIGGGLVAAIAGIAVACSAPVSIPVCLIAGAGCALLGAATGGAHSIMKICDGLQEESAANNFLRQAEHTKTVADRSVVSSKNPIKNLAIMYSDNHSATLTKEQISRAVKELGMSKFISSLYIQKPSDEKNSPVTVYYSTCDVENYNNVGDDDRNFEGRKDMPAINISRAYYDSPNSDIYSTGLLQEFFEKGKLTEQETVRFLEIAKALSTNKYKVEKEDAVNPNANKKEDVDFFDMNGDNKINFEDIKVVHNLLNAIINKIPAYKILPDNIKSFNIDVDGDGLVDEKDEDIFKMAHAKIDINADGMFNKKDKDILIKYMMSYVKSARDSVQTDDTQFECMGFYDNVENQNKKLMLNAKKRIFLNNLENQILGLKYE